MNCYQELDKEFSAVLVERVACVVLFILIHIIASPTYSRTALEPC